MMKIKRLINGQELEIELTQKEINEVFNQSDIQWAKDILENYAGIIYDYDNIITDEEKLLAFAKLLDEKNLSNNGQLELDTINELFQLIED